MSIITPQSARGLALARAAESMLRTLGGVEVAVRFASPATPSTADFGIASSTVADVPLSPVIVRATTSRTNGASINKDAGAPPLSRAHASDRVGTTGTEFLFAASAVEPAAQLDGYSSPIDWFAAALGIVFNNTLHAIASVSTENFAGQPYLYRVTTN